MIRVRACAMRAGAIAVAADPGSPSSAPRSAGNDLREANTGSAAHPGDPSSACVLASYDLYRVSYQRLKLQLGHESFEPACMPAGFHANVDLLARSRQTTIEPLRVLVTG